MGETKPERPAGGIPAGSGARDLVGTDAAPASRGAARASRPAAEATAEDRPAAPGGPSGGPAGGPARGSLRGGQWAARPEAVRPSGERPGAERPDGERPEGEQPGGDGPVDGGGAGDGGPGDGGARRRGVTTAVVAGAAVLLVGFGATVAINAHGHRQHTENAAATEAPSTSASSPAATTATVRPGLPSATPSPSKPAAKQRTAGRARTTQQAPPPAPVHQAVKAPKAPAGPAPVGSWSLKSGALGTDATNAHPATVYDVAHGSARGGCGVFNGKDSQLATTGPVVDTSASGSFTVSAWVYLTSAASFATAVSQDGNAKSAFYLQYDKDDNRWALAGGGRALSSAPPALNTWTHLVGVRDAATQQMTLYVDGVRQSSVKETAPLASTGGLAIGRAKFDGKYADFFTGQINDVEIFDQALTASQISRL